MGNRVGMKFAHPHTKSPGQEQGLNLDLLNSKLLSTRFSQATQSFTFLFLSPFSHSCGARKPPRFNHFCSTFSKILHPDHAWKTATWNCSEQMKPGEFLGQLYALWLLPRLNELLLQFLVTNGFHNKHDFSQGPYQGLACAKMNWKKCGSPKGKLLYIHTCLHTYVSIHRYYQFLCLSGRWSRCRDTAHFAKLSLTVLFIIRKWTPFPSIQGTESNWVLWSLFT